MQQMVWLCDANPGRLAHPDLQFKPATEFNTHATPVWNLAPCNFNALTACMTTVTQDCSAIRRGSVKYMICIPAGRLHVLLFSWTVLVCRKADDAPAPHLCRPFKAAKAQVLANLRTRFVSANLRLAPATPKRLASKRGFKGQSAVCLGLTHLLDGKQSPAIQLSFEWTK